MNDDGMPWSSRPRVVAVILALTISVAMLVSRELVAVDGCQGVGGRVVGGADDFEHRRGVAAPAPALVVVGGEVLVVLVGVVLVGVVGHELVALLVADPDRFGGCEEQLGLVAGHAGWGTVVAPRCGVDELTEREARSVEAAHRLGQQVDGTEVEHLVGAGAVGRGAFLLGAPIFVAVGERGGHSCVSSCESSLPKRWSIHLKVCWNNLTTSPTFSKMSMTWSMRALVALRRTEWASRSSSRAARRMR